MLADVKREYTIGVLMNGVQTVHLAKPIVVDPCPHLRFGGGGDFARPPPGPMGREAFRPDGGA